MNFLEILYNELGVVVAFGLWFTIRRYRSRAIKSFPTSKGWEIAGGSEDQFFSTMLQISQVVARQMTMTTT